MQELVYGCSGDQALGALVYAPNPLSVPGSDAASEASPPSPTPSPSLSLSSSSSPSSMAGAAGDSASDSPPQSQIKSAVIDVHGGAWYRGDKAHGAHYCRELARRGWLVVAPDFRDASIGGQHPDACRDITACVRYLRTHAGSLGIEPDRIALLGSSSGGHLAMLSALGADSSEFDGTLINASPPGVEPRFVASDVSAAVISVVALWPVADPLYRYRYAKKHQRTELLAGHDAYFGTEQAMARASIARLVAAGEARQLPPLFIVQAGADANVPPEMLEQLTRDYQRADGAVQCAFYPGMPHGFACRAGGLTDRCIHDVHSFLQSCLIPVQPKPARAGTQATTPSSTPKPSH